MGDRDPHVVRCSAGRDDFWVQDMGAGLAFIQCQSMTSMGAVPAVLPGGTTLLRGRPNKPPSLASSLIHFWI